MSAGWGGLDWLRCRPIRIVEARTEERKRKGREEDR